MVSYQAGFKDNPVMTGSGWGLPLQTTRTEKLSATPEGGTVLGE